MSPPYLSIQQLALALDFFDQDLAANRLGRLSPRQLAQLTDGAIAWASLLLVLVGLSMAIGFGTRPSKVRGIAEAAIALVIGGALATGFWKALVASRHPQLVAAEGAVSYQKVLGSSNQMLVVGGYTLPLTRGSPVPRLLPPGGKLRVYYVEQTRALLSAEPIAGPGAMP